MDFNIKVPQDWKPVAKERYGLLGLKDEGDIKCLGAYVVGEEQSANLISFLNYEGYGLDFLHQLDAQLLHINEMNDLIDGDPNAEGYEDTSMLKNIFHGFTDKYGGNMYININKVPVTETEYGYSFQMFVEVANGLMCAQATVRELDEANAFKTAVEVDYVKEMVKILFKQR